MNASGQLLLVVSTAVTLLEMSTIPPMAFVDSNSPPVALPKKSDAEVSAEVPS